jgi:lantibiotic modifying enzyme
MRTRNTGKQKVSDTEKQEVSDADKQEVSDVDQEDNLTDVDAEVDEWDDAEYERQMRVTWARFYSAKLQNEVRDECKKRELRIWGHKHLLVERIVNHDIQEYTAWGADRAIRAEEASGGEEASGRKKASGGKKK